MSASLTTQNTALLIIDLQVDFLAPEGIAAKLKRPVEPMQEMLPHLKRFYKRMKREGMQIIFTQFVARKDISPKNVKINRDRSEKNRMCHLNSKGAEFYFITPDDEDIIVCHKYFDAFSESDLLKILKALKVKNLLISGVRTEIAIDATAKRAVSEGFNVILLKDLIGTYTNNLTIQKNILEVFDKYYGDVWESRGVVESLS